jgi:LysM repeat protein
LKMGKWFDWQKVSDGPFQGTPSMRSRGLGASGYILEMRNKAGDIMVFVDRQKYPDGIMNRGGAGLIEQMPIGGIGFGGVYARGKNGALYDQDIFNDDPISGKWRKVASPGKFISDVYSTPSITGYAYVHGEGTEHQLAYAEVPLQDRQQNKITTWQNLGKPGMANGKKGMQGPPAVIGTNNQTHILVRGQDNHLWHLSGQYDERYEKASFGKWTNLGGGLTQPPVVTYTGDGFKCFVVGEKQELQVISWSNGKWSGFKNLGGKLNGLPAAITLHGNNLTYVYGRGVHGKLWCLREKEEGWRPWYSLGGKIEGDPALWQDPDYATGGAYITCMVRGEKGQLWSKTLKLTKSEYARIEPANEGKTIQYTMQAGDWLYRIGNSLNVDINAIKRANSKIANFDHLQAGTKLTVPVTVKAGNVRYVVQEGDSLARVAAALGSSVAGIKKANKIQNENWIQIGQSLNVPV